MPLAIGPDTSSRLGIRLGPRHREGRHSIFSGTRCPRRRPECPEIQSGGGGKQCPARAGACSRNSNGLHRMCSSRHSNQFPTKPPFLNSMSRHEIRTSLGDQGSQVRVLSPRFAAQLHCAVKPFPLSCSRFQLAGISHFAGTSPHSLIDALDRASARERLKTGSRAMDVRLIEGST
jgi:hypothetical protein